MIEQELIDRILANGELTTAAIARIIGIEIRPEFELFSWIMSLDPNSFMLVTREIVLCTGQPNTKDAMQRFINKYVIGKCEEDEYREVFRDDPDFNKFHSHDHENEKSRGNRAKYYIIKVSALQRIYLMLDNDQGVAIRKYYQRLEHIVKVLIPYLREILHEKELKLLALKVKELSHSNNNLTKERNELLSSNNELSLELSSAKDSIVKLNSELQEALIRREVSAGSTHDNMIVIYMFQLLKLPYPGYVWKSKLPNPINMYFYKVLRVEERNLPYCQARLMNLMRNSLINGHIRLVDVCYHYTTEAVNFNQKFRGPLAKWTKHEPYHNCLCIDKQLYMLYFTAEFKNYVGDYYDYDTANSFMVDAYKLLALQNSNRIYNRIKPMNEVHIQRCTVNNKSYVLVSARFDLTKKYYNTFNKALNGHDS